MTPDANDLCVFAVKRGYIESKEIYCNPLYPTYLSLVEKYQHSPYANGILNNHVAVNPKTDCSLLSDSSEVSFVPMANVQEKTNVVSYDMVAYETVKKGFTVFQRGDLIWAKITPCMQNGKSCIVDKMPTEIGFGSTEFHVIRKRNENVYMPFIWAILSSDDVLKAAQATFSGSAGQQRVSASFIENFPAVLPDYPVQVRLVAELEDKLNLLNGKLQRAYELLHKTPMYLIDRLGLTFDFSATQKITYATTVANITWSEKYQITDAQIDTEQNAASNAECIEAIFNRYVRSTEQTIFMSRCFSAEYNETENAIRRAINEINNEKKTGIMLIRVDEHHEGTTGQISDRIFRDIESAGLVIADLSSGKLNVPHEIGYAMGLKKDLILVHNGTSEEAEKHIPSNIRMFEQIRFNGDYQTLQNEIKRRLIDYYKL